MEGKQEQEKVQKRVELLSPAGNYEGLVGAVNAGADAVYFGGKKFGARAYADNFNDEDAVKGISYAHLHGVCMYLTLNTLVKEREFHELYGYLLPFYEAGLDGIIVQDVGVLNFLKANFPDLPIHISTQMTVTGKYGAEFLRKQGAVRIVPARELGIREIQEIKNSVDIELETFIHGALCYSYSGQCLFSSMLGGRSGNRGRCAQPCRLPYTFMTDGDNRLKSKKKVPKAEYYLSMKDLCTIELIPLLIEAGIDSFKIEGRMKNPEYTAGVTALYRKYIDLYEKGGRKNYQVDKKDIDFLKALYIRSDINEGYYQKHNGRDMITVKQPGYNGSNDDLLTKINKTYISCGEKTVIEGLIQIKSGMPVTFKLTAKDGVSVTVKGTEVTPAEKRPVTEEEVKKQISKLGSTFFQMEQLKISLDNHSFIQMKELNQIRREGIKKLEEEMAKKNGFILRTADPSSSENDKEEPFVKKNNEVSSDTPEFYVSILSKKQWKAIKDKDVKRIYLHMDLLFEHHEILKELSGDKQYFVMMPHMVREIAESLAEKYKRILSHKLISGVLVKNLESFGWLEFINYTGKIAVDSSLYIWNTSALSFWKDKVDEWYAPIECNRYEIKEIWKGDKKLRPGGVVYGRAVMMISANCLSKTTDTCRRLENPDNGFLTDRYGKHFPVYLNCRHCYNIIYNTVPTSLHGMFDRNEIKGYSHLRIDFTVEDERETSRIWEFFSTISRPGTALSPDYEYTTGHDRRGVE